MKKMVLSGLLFFLLGMQLIFFFWNYFFGASGYQEIKRLMQTNQELTGSLDALEHRVEALAQELDNFKKYPYYKEKIIREELQMVKPHETMVIIS